MSFRFPNQCILHIITLSRLNHFSKNLHENYRKKSFSCLIIYAKMIFDFLFFYFIFLVSVKLHSWVEFKFAYLNVSHHSREDFFLNSFSAQQPSSKLSFLISSLLSANRNNSFLIRGGKVMWCDDDGEIKIKISY